MVSSEKFGIAGAMLGIGGATIGDRMIEWLRAAGMVL
jgi:hypothetical protein